MLRVSYNLPSFAPAKFSDEISYCDTWFEL